MRLRRLPTLLVPLILASCGQAPPLVIGHIADVSGSDKGRAEQEANAIKLALADYAAEQGDKPGRQFAVRHADGHDDLDTYEGQAVRLASVNLAAALLGGPSIERAQRLAEAGVPVIADVSYPTARMRERVVATGLAPEARGKALASYLHARHKAAAITIVSNADDEDSRLTVEAFRAAWPDGKSLEMRTPPSSAEAWTTLFEAADPKSMLVLMSPADLKEAERSGCALAYAGPELGRQHYKGYKASLCVVTAFASHKDAPRAAEFARKYVEKYKVAAEPWAALAYDNVRIGFELLKRGPFLTSKLPDELQKLKEHQGLAGTYPIVGTTVRRPAFVGRLQNGSLTDVDAYPPEAATVESKK